MVYEWLKASAILLDIKFFMKDKSHETRRESVKLNQNINHSLNLFATCLVLRV